MKQNKLFALFLAVLAGVSHATSSKEEEKERLNCSNGKDCWNSPDKRMHLVAGVVAGYGGTLIASKIDFAAGHRVAAGTAFGCAVGVGKELIDARFSSKDAIVTCLGAIAGAQLGGLLLDYNERTRTTTVSYAWKF